MRANPLARSARSTTVPVHRFDAALPATLRSLAPDLLCVATFPHRITALHLAAARLGGLNIHTSLLPRHRGPDPLFWTYFHDDALAGVTIHVIVDEMDAGDIVAQAAIPLRRGRPVTDLYAELAELAAETLVNAVDLLASGNARPEHQEPGAVTIDPRPLPGTFGIDFETWDSERLWHFLSGIAGRRSDLLPVAHGPVIAYAADPHGRPPGTIERQPGRLRVFCRDGWVDVARPSAGRHLRTLSRKVRETLRRLY